MAHAASGDLDENFDVDGKVITDFGGNDLGRGIVLQPDGKMIVAGKTFSNATKNDFAVARYNTDGSLDSNFGTSGKVITDFVQENDEAYGVALQSDGKIVVAGISSSGASTYDFAVVRYNPDGSLDSNFGSGGKVITDFAGDSDQGRALVIQSDGKIVVAGITLSGDSDFALVRYNSDGSIDTSFGFNGKISTDFPGLDDDEAYAVAIQGDQRIVVVGRTFQSGNSDFAIARYNQDGSLDTSFDTNGIQVTDYAGGEDDAYGVAIQTDGKILAVGGTDSSGAYDFAVVRYNSDGSLDTTFNFDGKVATDFANDSDQGIAVILQFDGKIIVAGVTAIGGSFELALARYTTQGSLDGSFNGDGKVVTDFGGTDAALGVVLQPDGKIVAAGYTLVPPQTIGDFALARYEGDPPPVCDFCDDFEDGILASSWTYVKQQWSEANGNLIGTPTGRKAETLATPAFAGCSTCSVQARMSTAGGNSNKVYLLAWYTDKKNYVELLMREDKDKWILKHRKGGNVVTKMTASSTILPNVFYDVELSFDGTDFTLIVNGTTLKTTTAVATPSGTVGFRVKGNAASFASIMVN
jgi:uncharacterized delta-60 repeat protein